MMSGPVAEPSPRGARIIFNIRLSVFKTWSSMSSSSAAACAQAQLPATLIAASASTAAPTALRTGLIQGMADMAITLKILPEKCPEPPSATGRDYGPDRGAFTARSPNRDSYNSPATPTTIATSARLKTYQLKVQPGVVMWKCAKSATAP